MLLTPPRLAVLAEPRHHVGLEYGQEVGLTSSSGSGSPGAEADCRGQPRENELPGAAPCDSSSKIGLVPIWKR